MKYTLTKLLSLALVILLLSSSALGCSIFSSKKEESEAESTTEAEEAFELTRELLASYVIIIPTDCDEGISDAALLLQEQLKKITNTVAEIKIDLIQEGSNTYRESEYEILIGPADRQEAKSFHSDLKNLDSGYALINKKIVLAGYSPTAAENSVYLFYNDILKNAGKADLIMTKDMQKTVRETYTYSDLTLNGASLSEYTIVYSRSNTKTEKMVAASLAEKIKNISGIILPVTDDRSHEPTGREIQIGDTNRISDAMISERNGSEYSNEHSYIGVYDNGIWISGSSYIILNCAIDSLMSMIQPADLSGAISISSSVTNKHSSLSLKVLNYNVKYDLETDERNPDGVIATIISEAPDVFGAVEVTEEWKELFDSSLGQEYTCVTGKKNTSSDDGEYCAIFYKTDEFELIDQGTKWFSRTPDRQSLYSGAKHYMTFNYAELLHKASGVKFMFITAHFEPYRTSATDPNQIVNPKADDVRIAQANQLKAFIDEQSLPVVLVGDFNDPPTSKSIKELLSGQVVSYAMDIAKEQVGKGGTLISSDYKTRGSAIYDYVFVTAQKISVARYEIIDNKVDDAYPSDHLPVSATVSVYQ